MDAVSEYRNRRKARLGAKAIERYKTRRDARLYGRIDGGNTAIPFGLCQREGIEIDPKWTPRDAWNALEKKGYSASEVYKGLKRGKDEGTKEAKKISESHFPSSMTTNTYRKNTMEFVNYLNDHCDDDGIKDFLSCATAKGAQVPPSVRCRRTVNPSGAEVGYTFKRSDGSVIEAEIVIPNLSKVPDGSEKQAAMMSFAHEWTHYIDLLAREGKAVGHFSNGFKDLHDAIDNDDGSISNEVTSLFEEMNKKFEESRKDEKKDKTDTILKYAEVAFGEVPSWIMHDGSINRYVARDENVPLRVMNNYAKEYRKIAKDISHKWQFKREALMDGVSSLQGLYDSLHGGELRATGKTKYGHSTAYFKRDKNNKAIEMLADYVALKAFAPNYAKLFQEDKPEIAKQLDSELSAIVKKLRGD